MGTIQFFFEFTSPYSYIASLEIEAVSAAAGRSVEWRPIELGKVWQAHGVFDAYMQIRALKAPYIFRDAMRTAKLRGIRMAIPKTKTAAPDTLLAKLAYWGIRQEDPARAKRFLQLVWHRYFAEGQGIGTLEDCAQTGAGMGLTAQEIEAAAARPGTREAQDASNGDAVAYGCFGVPWLVADGECFFGQDRLPHLEAHLGKVATA